MDGMTRVFRCNQRQIAITSIGENTFVLPKVIGQTEHGTSIAFPFHEIGGHEYATINDVERHGILNGKESDR